MSKYWLSAIEEWWPLAVATVIVVALLGLLFYETQVEHAKVAREFDEKCASVGGIRAKDGRQWVCLK